MVTPELATIIVLYILGAVRMYSFLDLADDILHQQGYQIRKSIKVFSTVLWPIPTLLYLFDRREPRATED